jgi:hypothetical protein
MKGGKNPKGLFQEDTAKSPWALQGNCPLSKLKREYIGSSMKFWNQSKR